MMHQTVAPPILAHGVCSLVVSKQLVELMASLAIAGW